MSFQMLVQQELLCAEQQLLVVVDGEAIRWLLLQSLCTCSLHRMHDAINLSYHKHVFIS